MRKLFVAISKLVFNLLYRLYRLTGERERTVLFLSRQANIPSYDYITLAREFERRGWTAIIHVKKLSKRTALAYVGHVLREIRLLAHCRVAIVDRYDPIISLIDFKCESPDALAGSLHHEFPVEPVVIQLWHAFGAYKRFGYQSIGTREGHSREVADVFNVHRNYSWVVCSGEGCRRAFAEAFACPVERVVALNRPEYDELMEMAKHDRGAVDGKEGRLKVLMAPTLRKSKGSLHPFRELYEHREALEGAVDADFVWSFHPLEDGMPAPGNVSVQMRECNLVVTDYSSIVYEAFLLGKPVLFYTPDIEQYRKSPGLNSDPGELCPRLTACDEQALVKKLQGLAQDAHAYEWGDFERFCATAFDEDEGAQRVTSRIADFIESLVS